MRAPSTRVQNNFGKYLSIANGGEVVFVTKNGKDYVRIMPCSDEYSVSEMAAPYNNGFYERGHENSDKKKVTYKEFIELTENSSLRYELIDGEVFVLSSPNYFHQFSVAEIHGHFYNWFKGQKCRPLLAPFDVTLFKREDDPDVVQPDIIIICDIENIDEEGKYKGVPTLAVEVLSPSTRRNDMLAKLDLYMKTGVREYWIVDPSKKEIYVYTFKDKNILDYKVYTDDKIVKSDVFEGLEISLTELFY